MARQKRREAMWRPDAAELAVIETRLREILPGVESRVTLRSKHTKQGALCIEIAYKPWRRRFVPKPGESPITAFHRIYGEPGTQTHLLVTTATTGALKLSCRWASKVRASVLDAFYTAIRAATGGETPMYGNYVEELIMAVIRRWGLPHTSTQPYPQVALPYADVCRKSALVDVSGLQAIQAIGGNEALRAHLQVELTQM